MGDHAQVVVVVGSCCPFCLLPLLMNFQASVSELVFASSSHYGHACFTHTCVSGDVSAPQFGWSLPAIPSMSYAVLVSTELSFPYFFHHNFQRQASRFFHYIPSPDTLPSSKHKQGKCGTCSQNLGLKCVSMSAVV